MIHYIIYDHSISQYWSDTMMCVFSKDINYAKAFKTLELAQEEVKKLPSGLYEIKKIY